MYHALKVTNPDDIAEFKPLMIKQVKIMFSRYANAKIQEKDVYKE